MGGQPTERPPAGDRAPDATAPSGPRQSDPSPAALKRLDRLRRQARRTVTRDSRSLARHLKRGTPPGGRWRRRGVRAVMLMAVMVLPPFLLVGGATWLYRSGMPSWGAVAIAAVAAGGLLTACGAAVSKTLTGKARIRVVATRVVAPATVAFLAFSLLYLSSVNAKTEAVRLHYRTVHPMLRLAVATAILADRNLVVTAGSRVPEDYDRMGLPRYENSLHFAQSDGYVHAVDLRTLGRSTVRNVLLITYFRALGFRTLRHVGTADHLHVSLPIGPG